MKLERKVTVTISEELPDDVCEELRNQTDKIINTELAKDEYNYVKNYTMDQLLTLVYFRLYGVPETTEGDLISWCIK